MMKLKSYFAPTVEAAMKMARHELGDDAMLVSTKRSGAEAAHLVEYEVVFATANYPDAKALPGGKHHTPQVVARTSPPLDRLSEEVAGLKSEMERLASALARSTAGVANISRNKNLGEILSQLIAADLDPALAQDLVAGIASQAETGASISPISLRRLVTSELTHVIEVDSQLPSSPEKKAIVLVGPPGAGKTTTLVKLAVKYGLGTRRPSHILTVDTHRVASTEPLRSYAAITGLGFQALDTPRALAQAIEELRSKELIFIDTPGISNCDLEEANPIAKLVSRHPHIETHLVLSASMKPSDMNRMAQLYEMFAPTRLIFTHLDETETFGPLLNLSIMRQKPVSFLCRGPQIPEDLEPATRQTLIDLVLKEVQPRSGELISTAVA